MAGAERAALRNKPGVAGHDAWNAAAVEQEILDFLDGRNDGAALFDALYGDTLDDLLPPQLADLLANKHVS